MTYQPSEAEYAAMEFEELWTQRLLVALQTSLSWLRPMLIPANYETLVAHLVDKARDPLPASQWTPSMAGAGKVHGEAVVGFNRVWGALSSRGPMQVPGSLEAPWAQINAAPRLIHAALPRPTLPMFVGTGSAALDDPRCSTPAGCGTS